MICMGLSICPCIGDAVTSFLSMKRSSWAIQSIGLSMSGQISFNSEMFLLGNHEIYLLDVMQMGTLRSSRLTLPTRSNDGRRNNLSFHSVKVLGLFSRS